MEVLKTKDLKIFFLPSFTGGLGLFILKDYFIDDFQMILGLLIAPFVFHVKEKGRFSNRYLFASLLFAFAHALIGTKLFLYLAICSLFLFSIETSIGLVGLLPFFLFLALSPALSLFINTYTFSLRLGLSQYSGELLRIVGYSNEVKGNYFAFADGSTFSVDKACLGLNMFNTGLAITALLIGLMEKKIGRYLKLQHLVIAFSSTVILLVLANFIRIIVLVIFKSMPETFSHNFIGILTMVIYIVFPVVFLVKWLVLNFGENTPEIIIPIQKTRWTQVVYPLIGFIALFSSISYAGFSSKTNEKDSVLKNLKLPGFTKLPQKDGVMEFRKPGFLVYIKPAVGFFQSDHPPALCWKGSGFDVEQISEIKINQSKVLMACLQKDGQKQFTAWWYDNGKTKTTDPFVWRFAKNGDFRIINITANKKEELINECGLFLGKNLF